MNLSQARITSYHDEGHVTFTAVMTATAEYTINEALLTDQIEDQIKVYLERKLKEYLAGGAPVGEEAHT